MTLDHDDRITLNTRATATVQAAADIDIGLRDYMLKIYNYMSCGLAVTGLVAYSVSTSETAMQMKVMTLLTVTPLLMLRAKLAMQSKKMLTDK